MLPLTVHSLIWAFSMWILFIPEYTRKKPKAYITSCMFTATRFTVASEQEQLKCPSIEKWTNKTWHIHTKEYCSAMKKKVVEQY